MDIQSAGNFNPVTRAVFAQSEPESQPGTPGLIIGPTALDWYKHPIDLAARLRNHRDLELQRRPIMQVWACLFANALSLSMAEIFLY